MFQANVPAFAFAFASMKRTKIMKGHAYTPQSRDFPQTQYMVIDLWSDME